MSNWQGDKPPRIHVHTPCAKIREMVTHWVIALPKGSTLGPFNSLQAARTWVEEWVTDEDQKVCLIPVLSPNMVGSVILNLTPPVD